MGPVGDFLDTGSSSKSPYIGPLFDQSVAKSPWLLHSLLRNLSSNRCFCALLGGENRGFSIKGCLVMKNHGFALFYLASKVTCLASKAFCCHIYKGVQVFWLIS